jgi:lipoprotein-anchoring transpeptidase ErfK/SrfK
MSVGQAVPATVARALALLLAPVVLLMLHPDRCAAAQQLPQRGGPSFQDEGPGVPVVPAGMRDLSGRHVRISLEEHRLYVMDGERVVWSAVVGTGTGEILDGPDQVWDFSTPRGAFRVQAKERDPVWILPDWVFVKRGERIPPRESPLRRVEGMLGEAALYIAPEIAIRGTDEPELLGAEVSHGCIRMSNEDVRRLYDELEVGTPVIIF